MMGAMTVVVPSELTLQTAVPRTFRRRGRWMHGWALGGGYGAAIGCAASILADTMHWWTLPSLLVAAGLGPLAARAWRPDR